MVDQVVRGPVGQHPVDGLGGPLLEIACYTAVAAVALGTLAAFVLTRISQFKGRTLFGGLVTARRW